MAGCSHKKICISFDKSNASSFQNYIVQPRLSSVGRVYERNKSRKLATPTRKARSVYPLRENIWEYLNEDKNAEKFNCSKRRTTSCKQIEGKADANIKWLVFMLLLLGIGLLTYSRLSDFIAQSKFITKVVPKTRLISFFHTDASVEEECCYAMKTLAASLLRAEQALRNTQRIRRLMIIASRIPNPGKFVLFKRLIMHNESCSKDSQKNNIEIFKKNALLKSCISDAASSPYEKDCIENVAVARGSDTLQWGSRVALWGVLPLWRASPPPSTVLAKRSPVPSDCWPFSGSRGELVFQLNEETEVRSISIEHVRPDTAKSAPKNFVLYGFLENGTRITSIEAEYRNQGQAKQLFQFTSIIPVQKMILKIQTNQGNPTYTCVYRINLYRKIE